MLITRRELLAAGAAAGLGLALAPSRATAEVGPSFAPGNAALLGPATERGLAEAIEMHRRIVAAGGWPALAVGNRGLRPNDDLPQVAMLRQRLTISGDLPPGPARTFFDAGLRDAVLRYQQRHGLRATGIVAGLTLAHMNLPASERLQQLGDNLARLRATLGRIGRGRHVVVNVPAFELQAVADGRVDIATRVIVGKRSTQTPQIAATVQAVDLLPFWHVPNTIAQRDLVPTVRKDPTYLTSRKIRVFSSFGGGEVDPAVVNWFGGEPQRYVFRQDPGPQNALGLIRLDMPNREIVYMHDTPMKDLFAHDERAFSAGCVRVQSVADVAAWLIDGQGGWTARGLLAAAEAGQKQTVRLERPVPVHFVYLTAWVTDGVVNFRNDLYNLDTPAMPEQPTARVAGAPFQALAP